MDIKKRKQELLDDIDKHIMTLKTCQEILSNYEDLLTADYIQYYSFGTLEIEVKNKRDFIKLRKLIEKNIAKHHRYEIVAIRENKVNLSLYFYYQNLTIELVLSGLLFDEIPSEFKSDNCKIIKTESVIESGYRYVCNVKIPS